MHRTVRAALAALALLALPQFASAGPIQWGYRAESPDGAVLKNVTGLTELSWSDHFLPDPQVHGAPVPDPIPDNDVQSFIKRTEATVLLTDELSGESVTFGLYYDYREQYEVKPDGSLEPLWAGHDSGFLGEHANSPWEGVPFVLGGNTYTVRTLGGDLSVQIEPAPAAATPEPSTLVLAMCGAGVLGWRARRRMSA